MLRFVFVRARLFAYRNISRKNFIHMLNTVFDVIVSTLFSIAFPLKFANRTLNGIECALSLAQFYELGEVNGGIVSDNIILESFSGLLFRPCILSNDNGWCHLSHFPKTASSSLNGSKIDTLSIQLIIFIWYRLLYSKEKTIIFLEREEDSTQNRKVNNIEM